jgi:toxin ParE1/3/4
MKIVWSPLALEKASEIVDYISQDKPLAADNWIHTVFSKVDHLRANPEIGRIAPEINGRQFRALIYGNYRIIYHIGIKKFSILTIRHGKQILPIDEIKV